MGPRLFLIVCFAGLAAACLTAVGAGIWLIAAALPEQGPDITNIVMVYGGGLAFLLTAVIAVVWAYLDHALAQPTAAIVRGIQTVMHANPDHRIEVPDLHQLGGLPRAVTDLVAQLARAEKSVDEAIVKATEKVEQQKDRLGIILQDLHEGVVVCNLHHNILLYNTRALDLLHIASEIGLDRSLFTFMNRLPVLHALDRLTNRVAEGRHVQHSEGTMVSFVGSTIDGRHTLDGRMSLILDSEDVPTGYVISFEDDTEELAALGLRDRLLREATEGLRAPVANLKAAAEILNANLDMPKDDQVAFKQVMAKEGAFLADRLETLSAQYRDVITGHWPMTDIYSSNLFNNLSHRLKDRSQIDTVMIGIPLWVHGDSYTLVELLDQIIHKLSVHTGARTFDLEAVAGERHMYLDVMWKGEPIPASELSAWLERSARGYARRPVAARRPRASQDRYLEPSPSRRPGSPAPAAAARQAAADGAWRPKPAVASRVLRLRAAAAAGCAWATWEAGP